MTILSAPFQDNSGELLSIFVGTVKDLMFVCFLFPQLNKTTKLNLGQPN